LKEDRIPVGLIALALGGFGIGIGLTEFVILGPLPEVAVLAVLMVLFIAGNPPSSRCSRPSR
jgi:hypothetical protein